MLADVGQISCNCCKLLDLERYVCIKCLCILFLVASCPPFFFVGKLAQAVDLGGLLGPRRPGDGLELGHGRRTTTTTTATTTTAMAATTTDA